MISKEEIEKAKECLKETIQNTYAEGKAIKLNNALKYIDQLESDKKKLIEKLEEEKFTIESTYSQINGNYFMAQDRLDLIKEILSILKGENHE